MTAEYIYLENISIDDINSFASQGYQVISVYKIIGDSNSRFNIMLGKNLFTDISHNQESELITSVSGEFYLHKDMSYGDFLVITFLTIFLIFGITKFLINFFIPKFINFKK
jgi:hypothetical protein